MKVVIVGAGVIGASAALAFAQGGAEVTVLEAERAGSGCSGASFAWLNAANKKPRAYFDLNVAGMNAHRELARRFGAAPWLHAGGRLEWVDEARAVRADRAFERLADWGYPGGWVSAEEAQGLEPDLSLAELDGCRPAFFPDEGWIDPPLYARAMLKAAGRLGSVRTLQGARVEGLVVEGAVVRGVRLSDGVIGCDVVVNCAGAAVNVVAGRLPRLPLQRSPGLLGFTPPVPVLVSRIVAAPGVSVRPDGGGRLMVHSSLADAALPAGDHLDEARHLGRELAARISALLPSCGEFEMEALRRTERPIPADGFPAIGPWPDVEGYYMAVSHSAVTLAPVLGPVIADEVLSGRPREEMQAYRPGRFLAAAGVQPRPVPGSPTAAGAQG